MAAKAGWYDDGSGRERWWDGAQWTEQYRDAAAPAAPVTSVPATPAAQPTGIIEQIKAEAEAGAQPRVAVQGATYVVLQVVLKEKLFGSGSGNLTQLEQAINAQAALGYRLHTITTASSGSTGLAGGDRIQATMVFEKLS